MRKSFTKLLLAVMLVLAGVVGGMPQSKAAALSFCPDEKFCLWTSTYYEGSMEVMPAVAVGGCHTLSYPYFESIDSVVNYSSTKGYTLYNGSFCSGSKSRSFNTYGHGTYYSTNLHQFYPYFDNNIAGSIKRDY